MAGSATYDRQLMAGGTVHNLKKGTDPPRNVTNTGQIKENHRQLFHRILFHFLILFHVFEPPKLKQMKEGG